MSLKKKLKINHPCSELSWDQNQPSQHCAHCDKTVVNLSSRTEEEANRLLDSGRLECVSYARTPDGAPRFAPRRMLPLAGVLAASMACGGGEHEEQLTGDIAAPAHMRSNDEVIGQVAAPEHESAGDETKTTDPGLTRATGDIATPDDVPCDDNRVDGELEALDP